MNRTHKGISGVDLGMYRAWTGEIVCVISVDPTWKGKTQEDMIVTYMTHEGSLLEINVKNWLSKIDLMVGDQDFGFPSECHMVPKYRKITGWNFIRGSGDVDIVSPKIAP